MVKTRTVVQTRTHAQKYFQKLAKTTGGEYSMDDDGPMVLSTVGSHEKASNGNSERKSSAKRARRAAASPQSVEEEEDTIPRSFKQRLNDDFQNDYRDDDEADIIKQMSTDRRPNFYSSDPDSLLPSQKASFALEVPRQGQRLDFPQPSPAACGKRKHAELKAAQMLVGSGSSNNLDLEGAQVLSRLRNDSNEAGAAGKLFKKVRPMGLSLSIVNPGEGLVSALETSEPGTPWDSQIRALNTRSGRMFTPGNVPGFAVSVSTPAEQKQFVLKVQKFVRNGDFQALQSLLNAATATSVPQSGSNHSSSNNLEEMKSPVVPGINLKEEALASPVPGITMTTSSSFPSLERRTKESAIMRTLKNTDLTLVADAIILDPQAFDNSVVYDIVKLLTDFGASVTTTDAATGNSCLHFAAQQGLDRVGKLLLAKGCSINAVNKEGNAAVHLAAIAGHGAFLEMLASFGANFHLRNGQALSPIDLAGYASKDPGEREVLRRLMLSAETRLRTMVLYHPDFLEHSTRKPSDWEGPDRLSSIIGRLRDRKEFPAYELEISDQFDKADVALLGRVHSPEYLAFVNDLNKQVQAMALQHGNEDEYGGPPPPLPFTPQVQRHLMRQTSQELKNSEACDTSFSSGTLNAARRAAGAVAHAVDLVLLGRNRNVFCAVRPPGHHSGYRGLLNGGDSCGFCIFNNVAAGAMHALEEHKCERVAILDLDIHHGNGTEDIVKLYPHPSRLFFFSVHLYDHDPSVGYHFYPGTGERNDYVRD